MYLPNTDQDRSIKQKPIARREWYDIAIMMKEKSIQTRILYPTRLSLKLTGATYSIRQCNNSLEVHDF